MAYKRFCYRCNDRRTFTKVSGTTWKCRSCGFQVQHNPNKRDASWKNDPHKLDENAPKRRMKYED